MDISPLPTANKKRVYIKIVLSVIVIIIAFLLIISYDFRYYLDNVGYYGEQYFETKSKSSGFLGYAYASLALEWKNLYVEAITHIILCGACAVILLIVGGIGLYKGIKKLKSYGGVNMDQFNLLKYVNKIFDKSKVCIHCSEVCHKNENIVDKIKKINKKKLIFLSLIIVFVVICIISIGGLSSNSIKSEVTRYISETKKIDDVDEINAVFCITKKYYSHEENTLGYLILYNTKGYSEFAYFEEGTYKGNGYNGGDASTSDERTFYNMHSLNAISDALHFIVEENLIFSTCEEYYDVEKGVIYINLINIWEWFENRTDG